VCFWEFSGHESYLAAYDQFVGDPNSVYVVAVSCRDSVDEQRAQVHYWLDYLRCHASFYQHIGTYQAPNFANHRTIYRKIIVSLS